MILSRGFLAAAALILIALACIAVARRLERERRLIAKLRHRGALDPQRALPLGRLTEDERDTVDQLLAAGVLRGGEGGCYIAAAELGTFRRKRIRLAATGALAALALAAATAFVILHR